MIKNVSVQELCEQLDTDPQTVLIDLRAAREFEQGHIAQACNIPLGTIPLRQIMAEWSREAEAKPIYFICQSGGRSQQVLDELDDIGFHWAQSVAGGMVAWHALGLPLESNEPASVAVERSGRAEQIVAAFLVLAGCSLGILVNKGFFSVPILVALGMLFRGLLGWPGTRPIFGRKDETG
ncbi:MAG: rhodanese-like domain-containing protein [Nibricoccus sp.]